VLALFYVSFVNNDERLIRDAAERAIQSIKAGFDDTSTNRITAIADLLTKETRRALLLDAAKRHRWNLSRISSEFRLSGACNVIRMLKSSAPQEYELARRERKITKAHKPRRKT